MPQSPTSPRQTIEPPSGIKGIFRALKHRNFRLFYFGQGVSMIGTWMQQVAMGWLVYRLTDSATMLGLVGFIGNLPSFIFAPFGGLLADRWNRHRLMLIIQITALVQAAILAFLVLTNLITLWWVFALSILLGLVYAFDMPIRQAFMLDMIGSKEDLTNAIGLNSTLINSSRLIGPSIAGLLIAAFGEGICFAVNAVSFLAVLVALLAMKIPPRVIQKTNEPILQGLKEGFTYAFGFPPIRTILILVALVNLVAVPYTVLLPVFARDILHGGPHTLGFLTGAVGLGALVAAVYLAARRSSRGLGRVIAIASLFFGVGLAAFAMSQWFWVSIICILIAGFGMVTQLASSNTVLQLISEEDKRGRVLSFFAVAMRGMMPFGSLLAGSVAGGIGAPYTLLLGGICCVIAGLVYARSLGALRRHCPESDVFC